MSRCARPGCGHRRNRHRDRSGACKIRPSGHCASFVEAPTAPPPPPPPDPGIPIPAGASAADINAILQANPPGAVFQFNGDYVLTAQLKPRTDQTLRGGRFDCTRLQSAMSLLGKVEGVVIADSEWFAVVPPEGKGDWAIQLGYRCRVLRSRFHGFRCNGVRANFHGTPARVLLEDSEFHDNGFGPEWQPGIGKGGSGGVKFFESGGELRSDGTATGVTIRRCKFHHNDGNGIWFDHDNRGDLIVDNESFANRRRQGGANGKGIFYEVGQGPSLIRGNFVHDNQGIGIATTNTPRLVIERNKLGGNAGGGIHAAKVDRTDHGGAFVDVQIRDNALNGDTVKGCDLAGVNCSRNA